MLLLSVTLMAGAACVPPEKPEGLGKRWDDTTVMGEVQGRGTIRVAVTSDAITRVDDIDPYGELTSDFADYLASVLSVAVEEIEVPTGSLQTGLDAGDLDLAFPVTPITERGVRKQAFSDPLLVSHQRTMTPGGTEPNGTGKICAILDPDTGYDPARVDEDASVLYAPGPRECLDALLREEAAAITGLDVVLASVAQAAERECVGAECPDELKVIGEQLTTVGLGVLVERGAQGWVDYIDLVLDRWIEEGLWAESVEEHFGILGPELPDPPDLTVEEAAALYPSDA